MMNNNGKSILFFVMVSTDNYICFSTKHNAILQSFHMLMYASPILYNNSIWMYNKPDKILIVIEKNKLCGHTASLYIFIFLSHYLQICPQFPIRSDLCMSFFMFVKGNGLTFISAEEGKMWTVAVQSFEGHTAAFLHTPVSNFSIGFVYHAPQNN